VGMNPLAQALARSGAKVSGSDRYLDQGTEMDVFRKLRQLGISLTPQDGSAVDRQITALVVSTAIEEDNPDWLAAKALNIPVVHRATLLAELVSSHRCLAVAGTSGKTTLTGMIGTILAGVGWDPVVVNGGAVVEWIGDEDIGNVRWGTSPWWVIEVDESDRSLLRFYPELAVINNVTRDHFSLTESVELFQRFAGQCQRLVVLPQAAELLGVDRTFPEHRIESVEGRWQVRYRDVEVTLSVPGRHNAENALAALATADALGCPLAVCGGGAGVVPGHSSPAGAGRRGGRGGGAR
jgi:UDP-N-acetylmuramate--alanine ligase